MNHDMTKIIRQLNNLNLEIIKFTLCSILYTVLNGLISTCMINFHNSKFKQTKTYFANIDQNNLLKNKTKTECWKKYLTRFNKTAVQGKCPDSKWTRKPLGYRESNQDDIEGIIEKSVPMKKQG